MTEIAIYVEGGGTSAQQKAVLRQGLDALLEPQKRAAQGKKVRWKLVCCGSRNEAFHAFRNASKQAPGGVTTVLLVDSESPFSPAAGTEQQKAQARVVHLAQRDKAAQPGGRTEARHLCQAGARDGKYPKGSLWKDQARKSVAWAHRPWESGSALSALHRPG